MKIEAVVTCSHYSDFLEHTLVENVQQLDGMVVVTSKDDKETQRLCNKVGVSCVDTNVFYEKGDSFNKARGINLGLSHLRHEDWLLHMDADVLLPHRFKQMLSQEPLDTQCIYGADRVNTKTYDNWDAKRKDAHLQFRHGCLVNTPEQFPVGARLIHGSYGYCPIGYFQLWHSSQNRRYPTNQGSAEHTDVLFAVQWDRNKRRLLPQFFVYHLESEVAPMGANWKGRKTKQFKKGEK